MTNFTFNTAIPAANNNPSVDQPDMLTNNINTDAILAIDHVSFNSSGTLPGGGGGQHLKISFDSKNPPGPQVDPQSVLYTNSGTASTKADLFFRNENGIFRPNMIKADGVFTTVAITGPIALDMGLNVSSIAYSSVTQMITINLVAGAVNGTTVMVFVSVSSGTVPGWTFAANTLTLTLVGTTAGRKISFEILQV